MRSEIKIQWIVSPDWAIIDVCSMFRCLGNTGTTSDDCKKWLLDDNIGECEHIVLSSHILTLRPASSSSLPPNRDA